ncbi:MAG: hypothetical protein DRG78_06320 [Epsilonproteobacteria bacterium]|nr:MAG: hypothetical protein DRG78_06320 [Campylobacterota bacterium]
MNNTILAITFLLILIISIKHLIIRFSKAPAQQYIPSKINSDKKNIYKRTNTNTIGSNNTNYTSKADLSKKKNNKWWLIGTVIAITAAAAVATIKRKK